MKKSKNASLFLDIGNSTVTWAIGLRIMRGDNWLEMAENREIYVASVLSDAQNERILTTLRAKGGHRIVWAKSEVCWQGLRNGYTNPEGLGVDRWLAMVAAWSWHRGAWLVIDAGTAITVDWIDENGQHLGGHIIPGMRLCVQSLTENTARACAQLLSVEEERPALFADNTHDAITQGVQMAIYAYVRAQVEAFQEKFPRGKIVFGGGDGRMFAGLCPSAHIEPALVIKGLQARFGGDAR